jgi:hypothetical protein
MHLLRRLRTAVKEGRFPALVTALLLPWFAAGAQERPFAAGRPWTLEAGALRVESGLRFTFGRRLPLSGLSGDLLEVQAGVGVGLSDRVEGRVEGVAWQRMSVSAVDSSAPLAHDLELDGESARDAGDVTLATRVRLTGSRSGRLASALQLGIRLPVAGNESGLGRDVTDASAAFLLGWRTGPLRLGAEAAFAILGSPTRAAAQNDQGQLALLAELEPVGGRFALGVEARTGFGDEGVGNEIATEVVGGGRVRIASFWADLAYRRLVISDTGSNGFSLGVSRLF